MTILVIAFQHRRCRQKTTYVLSSSRDPSTKFRFKNNLHFIVWGFATAVSALKDLLLGKWWHALLFKEIVMAKAVQLSCKKELCEGIFVSFFATFTDRLDIFARSTHGAEIICYFYSSFDG